MKITKQIDENTFEVRLEDCDKRKFPGSEIEFYVAHDYVAFEGDHFLQTEGNLMINHMNGVSINNKVQIPITAFYQVILPMLLECPYLKEEHFDTDKETGTVRYDYSNEVVLHWIDNKLRAALKLKGDKVFSDISYSMYKVILEGLQK